MCQSPLLHYVYALISAAGLLLRSHICPKRLKKFEFVFSHTSFAKFASAHGKGGKITSRAAGPGVMLAEKDPIDERLRK